MRMPVLPRPPSLRASTTLARDEVHAGSRPDTTAAISAAPTVKASTGPSMSKVIHEGGGLSLLRTAALSQSTDTRARPMPSTAPMPATIRLSVSICRTTRPRVAPSEQRTPQLLGAQRGARELHVHHVHARDQQHAHAEGQHREHHAAQRRWRVGIQQRLDEGRWRTPCWCPGRPRRSAWRRRRTRRSPGRARRRAAVRRARQS